MADIRLRIEVNPNAETETLGDITNYSNDVSTNSNISNTGFKANSSGVFENLPEERLSGSNGLSMASDDGSDAYDFIFNDLDELDNVDNNRAIIEDEENPNEFIWGIVPSDKKYSVKLTFTNANALKDIVIYGDTVVGQFPTKAIIDGIKTIYSDDAKWAINMDTESDTHTIEFTEWNRANYNACISNLLVTLRYFDLDKSWINDVNTLSQSTSDPSAIQYGTLSNSGSANIRDLDGELKDCVQDSIISNSNVPIEIYVNGKQIQAHITSDSDYDGQDKILRLQMNNKINDWNSIIVPEIKLIIDISAYTLLQNILESVGLSDYFNEFIQDNDISNYLKNIKFNYIHLDSDNLKNILNYFCELIQCNLFFDEYGNAHFKNARPRANSSELNNAIRIRKTYMLNNLSDNLILKNKIKNISFSEVQFNRYDNTLPVIATVSGEVSEYTQFLETSSVWYSDVINDINSLNDNTTYTIEKYTDAQNRNWTIAYKKYSYDYYIRTLKRTVSDNGTFAFIDLRSIFQENNNFTTGTYSIHSIVDIDDNLEATKTHLDSNPNNFYLKFLTSEYSPTSGFKNIIQPIIAFTDNVTFPIRFYIASGFADTSTGKKTIIYEKLSKNETTVKYSNVSGNYDISFNNPLITNETIYNNEKISKVISDNIFEDYSNGVSNATVDVFCGDLYNSAGDKIKDWSKGEIISTGEIIYFDNDLNADKSQRYWRVTGRNFKYNGAPTISLELQEIVNID